MVKVLAASAFILSAAALALVAVRPTPASPGSNEARHDGSARAPDFDREEVDLRLRALEDNLAHLSRRLMAAEQGGRRPEGVQPSSGAAAPLQVAEELRQLRADIHAVASAEALHSDRGRQLLKEAVRSVQSEVQQDRVREFRDRQEAERDERVEKLVREARLTANQERDLRALFTIETAKRAELAERMRAGEGGRGAFGELRELRRLNDQEARKLLSPEQFEQYTQMRQEERRGWGGGGGGGGGRTRGQ